MIFVFCIHSSLTSFVDEKANETTIDEFIDHYVSYLYMKDGDV